LSWWADQHLVAELLELVGYKQMEHTTLTCVREELQLLEHGGCGSLLAMAADCLM
jgi:hypothetical protein